MKTLTHHLNAYLDSIRSLNYSRYSIRSAYYSINAFIRYLAENFFVQAVDQIRQQHLEQWQHHLGTHSTRKGQPLRARSVNKKIEQVRGFFKHLVRHGYLQIRFLDHLHYVKEPKTLPTSVMTHAQTKLLLNHIDRGSVTGYRDRAMLELIYSTGLRAGELLSLNINDIDLKTRTLRVNGKGNKERVVPIGATALRHLESYLTAIRPFLVRNPRERALFLNRSGNRLPYHSFLRLVHRYGEKANIDVHVTPHTFRRSCTTELIRGGADLYHVKELLGHESLETLKAYTKLTITDLKKTHAKCHPREKNS